MSTPRTPNTQLRIRRLPGLPGQQRMQFETLKGEILWTAPLDQRISKILNGRWTCTVNAYSDGREMEILGEAPDQPPEPPKPATPPGPPRLRLTEE